MSRLVAIAIAKCKFNQGYESHFDIDTKYLVKELASGVFLTLAAAWEGSRFIKVEDKNGVDITVPKDRFSFVGDANED